MTLSQAGLQGVLASATSKVFLKCLRITHSQADTLRLVNDKQDLVRADGTYERFPFDVQAPAQKQQSPPEIEINATSVDQRLLNEIRKLVGLRENAMIRFDVVLASQPDTIEYGPVDFEYRGVSTNGLTSIKIRAALLRGALDDTFPNQQFAPSNAEE